MVAAVKVGDRGFPDEGAAGPKNPSRSLAMSLHGGSDGELSLSAAVCPGTASRRPGHTGGA